MEARDLQQNEARPNLRLVCSFKDAYVRALLSVISPTVHDRCQRKSPGGVFGMTARP